MTDHKGGHQAGYVYEFRLTHELTEDDLQGICSLFKAAFDKDWDPLLCRGKYLATPLGYSLHAILRHSVDGIVGTFNVLPDAYQVCGQPVLLGISVDTMVHPTHRSNPTHLMKLAKLVEEGMKNHRIPFLFGFPNDNSFNYMQKILQWKPIGNLPYYILPLRPGSFKGSLKFMDWLWHALACKGIRWLPEGKPEPAHSAAIERARTANIACYQAKEGRHLVTLGADAWMVYSVHEESNGLKVAYLVDFSPASRNIFNRALKTLITEAKSVDAIAYIGTLPFHTLRMFRLPEKLVPKPLRLSGKILLDAPTHDILMNFSQWHANLATLDVR